KTMIKVFTPAVKENPPFTSPIKQMFIDAVQRLAAEKSLPVHASTSRAADARLRVESHAVTPTIYRGSGTARPKRRRALNCSPWSFRRRSSRADQDCARRQYSA